MTSAVETPRKELQNLDQILHLAHHRNKNQHRLSKWYKSFSQLRRQIPKLLSELGDVDNAISLSSTESKYVQKAEEKLALRIDFLRHHLVPKSYRAFGNLVADNQYATLGLLMMGALATFWNVLQTLRPEPEDSAHSNFVPNSIPFQDIKKSEDLGEIVGRPQLQDSEEGVKLQLNSVEKPKKRKITAEKNGQLVGPSRINRPKKRKKRDVFDDIFDALV